MSSPFVDFDHDAQGHWIRLETLIRVRWLASLGQISALLVADYLLGLEFPLAVAIAVVLVSVAANGLSYMVYPRSKRLSELEAALTLAFDLIQLSLLVFLTGGLNNPFALLMIAPVIISATALSPRSTLALGAVTVLFATILATFFEPLRTAEGTPILLPDLFRFGFWLAIVIGIAFIGLYARTVAAQKQSLTEALMAMRLALEREQKLTDLGGVVAAAAHELGTPLATIKLASAELLDALQDEPDLAEDARLIRDQADRCREILRSMGRAGKEDRQTQIAPFEAVLAEAAAPHADRGKALLVSSEGLGPMPEIRRRAEVIHGVRNLIQNAVDFAAQGVEARGGWDDQTLWVEVQDDGPGFPGPLLGRIGEPFLRSRRGAARPEYEGMGLGLFIAKALLERTGAQLEFGNADTGGALVRVTWSRTALEATTRSALGENAPHPTEGPRR